MDEEPRRHNESEPESDQETIQTSHASDNIIENNETTENDGNTSFDNIYNSYNKPGPRGRPERRGMGIIRNFVFNEGLLSPKQDALLLKCLGEVQQAEPSEAWDIAKVSSAVFKVRHFTRKSSSAWSPTLLQTLNRSVQWVWTVAEAYCRQRRIEEWLNIQALPNNSDFTKLSAEMKKIDWSKSPEESVAEFDKELADKITEAYKDVPPIRQVPQIRNTPRRTPVQRPPSRFNPVQDTPTSYVLPQQTSSPQSSSRTLETPRLQFDNPTPTQIVEDFIRKQKATLTYDQYIELVKIGSQQVVPGLHSVADFVVPVRV